MIKWLAEELSRKDSSLVGFWPFFDDGLDWSGNSQHAFGQYVSIPSTWATWYSTWLTSLTNWSYLSSPDEELSIIQSGGRPGLSTGGGTRFAAIEPLANYTDGNYNLFADRPFSISSWFRPNTDLTHGGLVSQATPHSSAPIDGWEIVFDNGFLIARYCGQGSQSSVQCFPSELSHSSWINIVAVFSPVQFIGPFVYPASIKLYINGRPIDCIESFFATGNAQFNLPILVGASPRRTPQGADYFISPDGTIGLTRFYSRELFHREIYDLYRRELRLHKQDLFVIGEGTPTNNLPIYVGGHELISDNVTIHVLGGWPNDRIDLYLNGEYPKSSDFIPLYVFANYQETFPIFVNGPIYTPTENYSIPLTLWGTVNRGDRDQLDLHMIGDYPSDEIFLYVCADNAGSNNAKIPLFINGSYPIDSDSITIYVSGSIDGNCPVIWDGWNTLWEHTSSPWDCEGFAQTDQNSVYFILQGPINGYKENHIPLHLRSGESENIPLYVAGPPIPQTPENITMFVLGGYLDSDNIIMYINGHELFNSEELPLYTHGF